jgi:hypothetical protein
MNFIRHPLLLSSRTFVKLLLVPLAFRLLGSRSGMRQADPLEVTRLLINESLHCEYPEILVPGRRALPVRILDYPKAEVYRLFADHFPGGLRVLDVGALYVNNKYLLTCGMHDSAAILATFRRNHLPVREVETLVLPWSHPWWSFGDFMLHVLPFLCRIWSTMDAASRANAVIGLYGIERNTFAYGFLELLGITGDQVVDLSRYRVELKKGAEVWTASGVPYTAYTAHPNDLQLVRSMIGDTVPAVASDEKLYLSRQGPRRYLQESELTPILQERGYRIIEDAPRSAIEQIQLFKSAKFVIGPHGAAFGNLLFSSHAALFEFQHPGWVQPGFRYLCHQMGHRYDVAIASKGKLRKEPTQGFQHRDIDIPIDPILSHLDTMELS